ncbi:MAG: insulinase family protein [Candidatus Margulisbacteria bacterium]|nr:insulinase family protein [Candidatus Margulisiibacteriota bacterium]
MHGTYNTTILENGLTIVTEEIPYLRSAAVGLIVGLGSKDEAEEDSGVSHFIEHMSFKGTAKRTAFDIAEALDEVGGKINAHTSKEYTSYYSVVLDTHVDVALNILSDIYVNSVFDEKEMKTEKKVVIEEINMYEDTPDELIHDLSAQNIWQHHPLGRAIIGEKKAIHGLTPKRILEYVHKYYVPENTYLAVAGNIKHQSVVDKIQNLLGGMQGKKPEEVIQKDPEVKPGIEVVRRETEQAHICLATKGVSYKDDDRYAVSLLSSIVGGTMSSRLFQNIRERKGLVYSIYSYQSFYKQAGLFTVYAGTRLDNSKEVLSLVLSEFSDIKKNAVSDDELNRAKEQLKGNIVLNLETSNSRMSWINKSQFYYGKILAIEDVFGKIDKVTREDIQRIANEIFIPERLNLTAIGSFPKAKYFDDLNC